MGTLNSTKPPLNMHELKHSTQTKGVNIPMADVSQMQADGKMPIKEQGHSHQQQMLSKGDIHMLMQAIEIMFIP
jgi:hypothetical protein